MPERLKEFLQRWVISTVAAALAANIVDGIEYRTFVDLVLATLLLGILNVFVRPILMLFSLPLLIVTLGLFTFVINALLLYLVGYLLAGFEVRSFAAAFWGGLVITIVSLILNSLTGTGGARFKVETRKAGPRPPRDGDDDAGGPVIDV
jgi:putative membrane protein